MLLERASGIRSSEITPKSVYLNRRKFIARASTAAAGLVAGRALLELVSPSQTVEAGTKLNGAIKSPFSTSEKQTPYNDVTHYNNFYEFGEGKEEPAEKAKNFKTTPWTVTVAGAVNKPQTFDMDAILKLAPLEERVYRHRCVEAWSIVVPWIGFPLNALIKQVEPTTKAKYVAFQSLYDPKQMPEARYGGIPFPYVEGLRMDEAMHALAIVCVGMYGEMFRTRTEPLSDLWFPGSTASKASSQS
jgi:sulfoxide reductase catalytic subunit YedY